MAGTLVERIAKALGNEPSLRTVRMFGGLSFMVDEKLVVAAREGDALLVRVDPERGKTLETRPGVARAMMGTGRSMGSGWLQVEPGVLDGRQLSFWIGEALAFTRGTSSRGAKSNRASTAACADSNGASKAAGSKSAGKSRAGGARSNGAGKAVVARANAASKTTGAKTTGAGKAAGAKPSGVSNTAGTTKPKKTPRAKERTQSSALPPDVVAFHAAQATADRPICEFLAKEISEALPEAQSKVWHRHPVWFLDGNPIVGYHRLKAGMRLLFWSGQSFDEPGLEPEGTFKAAAVMVPSVDALDREDLRRWLGKSREIQWDYQNLVKRKGQLLRRS